MMKVMGLFAFQRISIAIASLPRQRIRQPGAASRAEAVGPIRSTTSSTPCATCLACIEPGRA
ncbi:hypothetical protein [Burkholderia plantarii]|uniref:hypothetical protein n=1 Tax=Burkholderia plantarii TaxID=41899 RepID=UPI000F4D3CAD|nr:hypothetical protein [Burkholderia plantarii]